MVQNALLALLAYNDRVIIPNFGAILKHKDFSQSIFFNQFIRFNDGLLFAHLTKGLGLTEEEAKISVQMFIDDVIRQIQKKGSYHISGIGYFCIIDDRIEIVEQYDAIVEEPLAQPPANSEPASSAHQETHVNEWTEEVPEADEMVLAEETKPEYEYRGEIEPEPEDEQAEDLNDDSKRKESKPGPLRSIVLLFSAVILFPLLTFLAIRWNKREQPPAVLIDAMDNAHVTDSVVDVPANHVSEPSEEEVTTLSMKVNIPTIAELDSSETKDTPEVIYHLVVGSFSIEENATSLHRDLIQQGHRAEKYFRDGWYFVSIDRTTSLSDAVQLQINWLDNYPAAWISKEKKK